MLMINIEFITLVVRIPNVPHLLPLFLVIKVKLPLDLDVF